MWKGAREAEGPEGHVEALESGADADARAQGEGRGGVGWGGAGWGSGKDLLGKARLTRGRTEQK